MSGPIRKRLGPAKARLIKHLDSARQLVADPIDFSDGLFGQTSSELLEKLSSTLSSVDGCITEWNKVIESIGDETTRNGEQTALDNLTDGDGGLYELLLDGQDYLAAVRSRNAPWDQRRLEQVDRDSQTQSSPASQTYSQDFQTALEQAAIQAATAAAQASVQETAQSSASLATGSTTSSIATENEVAYLC